LQSAGYEVVAAPNAVEGRRCIESHLIDLAFLDLDLGDAGGSGGRAVLAALQETAPDVPVIVVTADDRAGTAIELLRRGAYDYAVKPVPPESLLHLAERGIELCTARRTLAVLRGERDEAIWDVGETPRMRTVEQLVGKFAPTEAGILIQGESGTGKEVVARTLHERSRRPNGAFVAVNCAALPAQLLESELFGHEKGSFTGAFATRRGLLEQAHRGTLFLDEVSMMSPEMQAKLLRALQEFRFRRVGGHNEIHVDVRVVSASNRSVTEAVVGGEFREDLFYRLCVMTIELPPLRARAVDIPLFVEKFLRQMREEMGSTVIGVSEPALWALCRYRWPGNIRELRNVIERAMILADGEERIDVVHLPEQVRAVESGGAGSDPPAGPAGLPPVLPAAGLDLKAVAATWEQSLIRQALSRTDGNQTSAARLLGLSRDELRYRMEKYALAGEAPHAA
jgi:DNA-binding NtrC family response regulator